MDINKLLERAGLKYQDLNRVERDTLDSWLEAWRKGNVTQTTIKDYVVTMRESVEQELSKTDHNTKQDIFLKARLRNYLLLEAFLATPERAQKQLEQAIQGLVPSR
jgi:hypothetical protein